MIPSFMDLQIAKRALQLSQMQIDITGQNINNADNPNYSRQVGNQSEVGDYSLFEAQKWQSLGQGAQVEDIQRVRDQSLDTRYRQVNSMNSMYQLQSNELQNIEGLFNEPSDNGFQTTMTNFFNAWQDLSKNPTDSASQAVTVQDGLAFTGALNTISNQLATLKSNYQNEAATDIQTVNNTTSQISQLTGEIQRDQMIGSNPNDLLDQRDQLLDQLSSYGDISISQTADSSNPALVHFSVTFAGKQVVSDTSSTAIDTTITPASGKLKALSDLQTYAQNVSDKLDALTGTIVNDVNNLSELSGYQSGQGVVGGGGDSVTGQTNTSIAQGGNLALGSGVSAGSYTLEYQSTFDTSGKLSNITYSLKDSSGNTVGSAIFNPTNLPSGQSVTLTDSSGNTVATFTPNAMPDFANNVGAMGETDSSPSPNKGATYTQDDTFSVTNGFFTGTNASDITVNPTLVNDPTKINVSANGSNALTISNLPNTNGYDQTYNSLISSIGADANTAQQNGTLYQSLVNQTSQSRNSVMGVSINEEMTNMIQYQQTYTAAAKLMDTIDQMYSTLFAIRTS